MKGSMGSSLWTIKHMKIILISTVGFFLLFFGMAFADDNWHGLPPDCWTDDRLYHSEGDMKLWETNTVIEHTPLKELAKKVFSPNKGYYFVRDDIYATSAGKRREATIYINSEEGYLIKISFTKVDGINDLKWINEKLLFIRSWWGRIVATDVIYDVENEKVLYKEEVRDGRIIMSQARQSCPLMGCTCIKKSQD